MTSSYRVIGLGALPVGAGAAGLLAKGFGLHMPYLVSGLVLAAATVACLPFITEVQVQQAEAEGHTGWVADPQLSRLSSSRVSSERR